MCKLNTPFLLLLIKLGNSGFQHVQWLMCIGRCKVQENSKAVANCEKLNVYACEFGKVNCLSNKVNTIKNNPTKEQDINKDHLLPGYMVSTDCYISWDTGRLYHTKGNSYPSDMF